MSDSDELPAASGVGLGCHAVLGRGGGGGMSQLQGRAAAPCCLATAACICHRQPLYHFRDNNKLDAVAATEAVLLPAPALVPASADSLTPLGALAVPETPEATLTLLLPPPPGKLAVRRLAGTVAWKPCPRASLAVKPELGEGGGMRGESVVTEMAQCGRVALACRRVGDSDMSRAFASRARMLTWAVLCSQGGDSLAFLAEQSMLLAELEPLAELLQHVLVGEMGLRLVLVLAAHDAELKSPVGLALPVNLGNSSMVSQGEAPGMPSVYALLLADSCANTSASPGPLEQRHTNGTILSSTLASSFAAVSSHRLGGPSSRSFGTSSACAVGGVAAASLDRALTATLGRTRAF
ncbi:MAG: hypothetical protein FRX49_08783 [Trebouxia sp. A1-2]|nr:MAG: hypothetical protein FRX49_08783 [Trebouxia sp. A1-2]